MDAVFICILVRFIATTTEMTYLQHKVSAVYDFGELARFTYCHQSPFSVGKNYNNCKTGFLVLVLLTFDES